MWRPVDWEKNKPPHMTIGENDAYENGTDAILEALVKDGWLEETNMVNEDPDEG